MTFSLDKLFLRFWSDLLGPLIDMIMNHFLKILVRIIEILARPLARNETKRALRQHGVIEHGLSRSLKHLDTDVLFDHGRREFILVEGKRNRVIHFHSMLAYWALLTFVNITHGNWLKSLADLLSKLITQVQIQRKLRGRYFS